MLRLARVYGCDWGYVGVPVRLCHAVAALRPRCAAAAAVVQKAVCGLRLGLRRRGPQRRRWPPVWHRAAATVAAAVHAPAACASARQSVDW